MKKKLLILMTVLLVVFVAFSIIACTDYVTPDDGDTEEDTITRTQLVTNGTFYNASSSNKEDYLKTTVTGWTASRGSLTTSANGVAMGVIDLTDTEAYDLNKDKFFDEGNVANPGVDPKTPYDTDDEGNDIDELQDNNALVIASKSTAGSVYYKNSSSYTLEAGKYYLLQYSVYTKIDMTDVDEADKKNKGAWVQILGGIQYVDSCINTNEQWETRYLYIEANKNTSVSLDIRLWLGNGPETISSKSNVYSTKGVVFFDNIICKEVTSIKSGDVEYSLVDDNGNSAHKNFQSLTAAALASDSAIGYESAYYITDSKLEQSKEITSFTSTNSNDFFYSFREGTYTSENVKNYTVVKGKKDIATSDEPSTKIPYRGIVDLSKLYAADATADSKDTYSTLLSGKSSSTYNDFVAPSYTDWSTKIMNGTERNMSSLDETKVLMIYNNDLTGVGYKSNSTIKIERDKYYAISVYAYVWVPTDADGNIAWPTANAPTAPSEYSAAQQVIVGWYEADAMPGAVFSAYITALTDEEKGKIETAPASETSVDDINTYAVSDELKADMIAAGYAESIYQSFTYKYIYDNFDTIVATGKLAAGDKNYIEYKYLSERNTFVTGDWKEIKDLIDKHNDYNNELTEYNNKYEIWKNRNSQPYAQVKLSGAGEDLVEKTTKCNEGWEKITFYVKGNQLSDRNLTLEFWLGEGTALEYENLMFGGVFFDDISINEVAEGDIDGDRQWSVLSPLSDVDKELSFGGLVGDEDSKSYWEYELADKDSMASGDEEKLSIDSAIDEDIGQINVNGTPVSLRQLIYKHTAPTASVLTSKSFDDHSGDITIKPNKAYRFAIRVKTEGIDEGKGITISLMGGLDGEDKASVASVSSYNSEEWQEIAFYIMGDLFETNYVGLQITMGSGSRFDTSSYVQGTVYLAVANCTEIKYSEYTAKSSGDQIKSYSFANTADASDSVTNGNFSSIDYSSTDEKEFDADGKLTGVASTSSWTKGTAKNNTYNAPSLESTKVDDLYTLTWDRVAGVATDGSNTYPSAYEVYARYLEGNGSEAKSVERLYKIVEDTGAANYSVAIDLTGKRNTSFRVRAVSETAVGSYSSYKTLGTNTSDQTGTEFMTEADEIAGVKETKVGTIAKESVADLFDGSSYKTPYSTVLMISSNYNVALSMTGSDASFSANKYYLVSVWVKTVDGAKASVTVSNVSNVLTADVDANYIGYVGIDTEGAWTQYCFYVKTGASSSKLGLELSLGNPYAIKASKKSELVTSSVATYKDEDLSRGTVYFDAIRVLEVEETEYNTELEKGEFNEDNTVKLHSFAYLYDNNKYAIRNLVYTIDSFDSFTENTTEEGKDGYNLGHTPNSYDWSKASDATGTTETQRLYGVYNSNFAEEKLEALYTNEDEDGNGSNVFESFMPENFDIKDFITIAGSNSLVMSNKVPYGQSYTTDSSSTIASKTYYKLTFKAKALVAKEVTDDDDNKTYVTDGVYAEFRFMQNASTDKYQSILINGLEEKEYAVYIYNPSSSSSSAKWAFYLGANADDTDTTGTKQLLMGMLVVDQVQLVAIDEEAFAAAKTTYEGLDDAGKTAASTIVYSYAEDAESDDDDTDDDTDTDTDEDKSSIWDRGDAWLLVSSIVIAVAIILVVVVVLVRRWKKKHPKEVVGENVVSTNPVKDIKVVETPSGAKEDLEEDEEYSDVVKPVYTQRVVNKGKKNKKKKK